MIVCEKCGSHEHGITIKNVVVDGTIAPNGDMHLWLIRGDIEATIYCNQCDHSKTKQIKKCIELETETNIGTRNLFVGNHKIVQSNSKQLFDFVNEFKDN